MAIICHTNFGHTSKGKHNIGTILQYSGARQLFK
jgi:hypothetical protein